MLLHHIHGHDLQRYCKHIIIHNESEQYPYTFRGSGIALRFGEQHFLFCCGHQFSEFPPDLVGFRPSADPGHTITSSVLHVQHVTEDYDGADVIDIRGFEFRVENYNIPNLTSDFLPVDQSSIFPKGAAEPFRFSVFGYPFDRQSIDYDEERRITTRVVNVAGCYEGRSESPWVHRLKMDRKTQFNPDGMSGGPVFYVGASDSGYFIGFAGVVIRGGSSSELLHFVEADYIRHFARSVPMYPVSR